ncbi:unnamed protein product [Phytophthora fragariaefolia]|uniref:Unnamed protein product n=1 Tax=Phytophthora fragariaefolia TaxID=1490495 RepID=A0A9W7CMD3_9STRA|nr:unnamed protein product [Phytophthora fragariaefolia]
MKISIVSATQMVAAMVLAALLTPKVESSKKFVKMIPNGGNVPDTPAIGHPDGTGKSAATNAFGDAFAAAGYKWTKELCQADTDGDGQTNGQELGDPCCEWDKDANPVVLYTTVSHPDDASKKSDPSLWASKCGSGTSSTSSATGGPSTSTTSSTISTGASSGSVATSTPSTSSTTSSGSSSATTPSSGSTASSPNSQSHEHDHSTMHMSNNYTHSDSTTGSLSSSGSSSSAIEVGSPSASSASSRSAVRSAGSESSAAPSPSSPSSSSNTPSTSGASAVSPILLMTTGAVFALVTFLA